MSIRICFINLAHIGDIFFSLPFVNHICNNNKNIQFYYFTLYGYSLFNNISNISNIYEPPKIYNKYLNTGDAPELNYDTNNDLNKMMHNNRSNNLFFFDFDNQKYVAINTWCGVVVGTDFDFNTYKYNFFKKISELSKMINININIDNTNINNLVTLPTVDITSFNEWYNNNNNNNKKLIFIYNYRPRSNIYNLDAINNTIKMLAIKYKQHVFIIPKYNSDLNNIENIKFCENDFNFIETPCCLNLLQIEMVTRKCDLVFTLPSGSNWLFVNNNIDSYTNKKYIINFPGYSNALNNWYKLITNTNNDIILPANLNDIDVIISQL
jgi:ADP-heptose:LPS heptosyltransferase